MLDTVAHYLVQTVGAWGYSGIFLLMFLESTFFPFPSEIVIIPAGYLAFKGKMSLVAVVAVGTLGSLFGALFNYYLARYLGRAFFIKYGKYLLVSEEKLRTLEEFFHKHGAISTFNGRLIPGIRQLISLPAGLAKMRLFAFNLYTLLGAGIWVSILALLGYFIGQNQQILTRYTHTAVIVALAAVALITLVYIWRKRAH